MAFINVVIKERCPILIPVSDAFIINAIVKDGSSITTYVDYPERRDVSIFDGMILTSSDIRVKHKIYYTPSTNSFVISSSDIKGIEKNYLKIGDAFIMDTNISSNARKSANLSSDMILDEKIHNMVYVRIGGKADMILSQSADLLNKQIKYVSMESEAILEQTEIKNIVQKLLSVQNEFELVNSDIGTISAKVASAINEMYIDSSVHGTLNMYSAGENDIILDITDEAKFRLQKNLNFDNELITESSDIKTLSVKSISPVSEFILHENTVRVYAAGHINISAGMIIEDSLTLYELRDRIFADMDDYSFKKFDQLTLSELDIIRSA